MRGLTLCYLRKNGQTLMLYRNRKKNDIHFGKYNGLGGKMDAGESPEECVIREVKEESGLILKKPLFQGILFFPNYHEGEDWLVFAYTGYEFSGELKESEEGELVWVDDEKILNLNLWEGDKIFLPWVLENRLFSAKFVYEDKKLKDYKVTFYNHFP